MSVLISVSSSTPRDYSEDDNAVLDDLSLSLSEGNWREHVREVFLPTVVDDELDLPIDDYVKAAKEFDGYHAGKSLGPYETWHVATARKLIALCEKGIDFGCDRLGVAG